MSARPFPTPRAGVAATRAQAPASAFVWRRSRVDFSWPVLGDVDPVREGLTGVPGVVVLWQGDAATRCVYAGQSSDLAAAVQMLRTDPAVEPHTPAGLNVTWAPVGVAHRAGIVAFLRETLDPAVAECSLDRHWPTRIGARPLAVPLPV